MIINIKKRIHSFGYALNGIFYAVKNETHLKIHIVIALFVCTLGFLLNISIIEWAICLLCIGLVIGMELINTAIERVMDLISPEKNDIVGKVKDIAAGAVLVCAIVSFVIGIIIFGTRIFALLFYPIIG
jgi:diacylglycerol kinase